MVLSPEKEVSKPWKMDEITAATYERFEALLSTLDLSAEQTRLIVRAHDVAAVAHAGQTRPDCGPYINHPLRVALTLATKFGVSDPHLLMAALLHDTVEDQAPALMWALGRDALASEDVRGDALAAIERHFGVRTRELVSHLTNPDFDELAKAAAAMGDQRNPAEIKADLYKEHFLDILAKDPEAFLIKLSDFSENAFQLAGLPAQRRASLARKYGPVIVATQGAFGALATDHPLYRFRDQILAELHEVYERDYR